MIVVLSRALLAFLRIVDALYCCWAQKRAIANLAPDQHYLNMLTRAGVADLVERDNRASQVLLEQIDTGSLGFNARQMYGGTDSRSTRSDGADEYARLREQLNRSWLGRRRRV